MFGRRDSRQEFEQEVSRLKDENTGLRDELSRVRQAIHELNELQQSLEFITPQSDLFTLFGSIVSTIVSTVDAENGALMLLDEDTGELVFVEVQGPAREKLLDYRLAVGTGVASWVAATRTPKVLEESEKDPAFAPIIDQITGAHTHSLVCIPLTDANRTLGVIEVANTRSGRAFKEDDVEMLLLLSRIATVALLKAEGSRAGAG